MAYDHHFPRTHRVYARASFAGALLLGLILAACSGSTGSAGPAGPAGATGPTGPQGSGGGATALSVNTATTITGTITAVKIGGPPVVEFKLADENGVPLKGLPAADLGWVIAQLVPGQNGMSSQWNSYIYETDTPAGCPAGVAACDSTPATQATVENAATGALVDNGDGTYQYTFKKDITKDPKVVYSATLTHRVAFEIRGLAQANNGSYTFQPSSGATTGIFSREIVDTATCDGCHTMLSEHGGARVEVQYCVMCHNPGTTDPYSGNSLDMKVMVHKIHTGNSLPSIQTMSGTNTTPTLGSGYWIVGYMESLNNFNTVVFPQDTRNCTTCHNQTHPNLTEAANYKTVPSMEACGACHDNIDFATGANHSSSIIANDTQCATCHGPTSNLDNGQLQIVAAHVIPEMTFQAQIAYNIIKATNTGPGQTPVIQFSVTNPTNGNKPWNLATDEPFTYCTNGNFGEANLNLAIAWSTTDYTNVGSGVTSEVAEPISLPVTCAATPPTANGDGTYTLTSPTAIPANIKGTAGILFQGHPAHDFNDGNGAQEIPIPAAVSYAPITDSVAVPRREVASVANCNVCHFQLNGHGNNRVDSVQACAFCHNPNATDVIARIGGGITPANPDPSDLLAEQTIDLKVMIHAIHASSFRASQAAGPYVVYHRGSANNFSTETPFPGTLNNCLACHDTDTYYPPDPSSSTVLATTISTYVGGVGGSGPAGQTAVTPAAAACSACHTTVTEALHMTQNGGSFNAIKDANSHVPATESCIICHGPGGIADVKVVHNIVAQP
jgi:OmcA/MtrC family decaheme c-type cytochrome